MLRLNRYILALVLWVAFLFNVERFDAGGREVFNISSSIYFVAVLVAVVGLSLPHWVRTGAWVMYAIALLAFILAKSVDGRPMWGAGQTYLTFFEASAIFITTTLAHTVGRLSNDFVEAVRALTFAGTAGPVYAAEEAEQIVKRELQYSRRANRPLTVMVIEANPHNAAIDLHATAREIQQLLVRRYSLVALTRLLAWRIRRTDFVVYQTLEGRLVLIAPRAGKDQTASITSRLNEQAQRHLGITLQCGVATFPDEGVTFEELVAYAEQALLPKAHGRPGETGTSRRDAPADEQRVVGYQQP